VQPDGRRQILQAVLAEVAERELPLLEQGERRRRDENLASVAARADPCGPMDVHPDVVPIGDEGLTGVQTHPEPNRAERERVADVSGACDRRAGGGEGAEERVALRVDLHPAVAHEGGADDLAMASELRRVGVGPELAEQAGRSLDVREEERDRPGRERVADHGWSVRRAIPLRPARTRLRPRSVA